MAKNAIASFHDLVALGISFVREGDGYAQRFLAGNSYPRGVYTSAGGMGKVIVDQLSSVAAERSVRRWSGTYVVGLLRHDGVVVGALLADHRKERFIAVHAKTVVMAMGGIGKLYQASTYPTDVSADSDAIALEAGGSLIDMEFVQFEPTVTVYPEGARGMEMPTAMLGDGAQLLNANGERFMFRHNPQNGERLIEKAKMSFFIQQEIDEGRGLPDGTVHFNTSTVPVERLESYVSHCKRLRNSGLGRPRKCRACVRRRIARWAACHRWQWLHRHSRSLRLRRSLRRRSRRQPHGGQQRSGNPCHGLGRRPGGGGRQPVHDVRIASPIRVCLAAGVGDARTIEVVRRKGGHLALDRRTR